MCVGGAAEQEMSWQAKKPNSAVLSKLAEKLDL